jgi:hypothetical protein
LHHIRAGETRQRVVVTAANRDGRTYAHSSLGTQESDSCLPPLNITLVVLFPIAVLEMAIRT